VIDIIFNGEIKISEENSIVFISEFDQLLQKHSAQFRGLMKQSSQYEEAEIIEEIIENV
jgi:hypothetical protein